MRLDLRYKEEKKLANNNLTIKLTNEQQKQIREATGKNIAELNIDLAAKGHLTEKELDQVAGGYDWHKAL